MSVPFLKMNGLGNDFVVLDARARPVPMTEAAAARIADRLEGVGCDQVIVIEPPRGPADAFLRIYNQDGGEVAACGNASRCIAELLFAETGKDTVVLETAAGLLHCIPAEGGVTVDMGAPKFDWQDIPLAERMDTRTLDIKLGPIDKPVLFGPSAVNVGNPHCIFFVDDVAAHALDRFGPLIENHPLFPQRTNVSLAQVVKPDVIRLRVWERGVGITLACGTAACAVVPAAVRRQLASRKASVLLDGGALLIEWREANDHITMTGPTSLDYEDVLDDSYFKDFIS